MSKSNIPELKCYMDKRVFIQLNGKRAISGVVRGFDPFLNLVLDDAVDETDKQTKAEIGKCVLRGSSIVMMEAMEQITQ